MSSPFVSPPVVKPKSLECPNCGGPVERRGFGHTLTIVCPQCLSVLDATTPALDILQKVEDAQNRRVPLIPLGQRGNFQGATWEVIGFQTRAVSYEGETFEWDEYLLFNPYKGFRYITQYNGHWNWVTPMESLPVRTSTGGKPAVSTEGRLYKHFSGGDASTTFVLGEFPWRVRVGDFVTADDFIDPPGLLSSETTVDEVTWSRGEYTSGADIWKAFQVPGSPPSPSGIYLNQPSPFKGSIGGIWRLMMLLIGAVIFLAIAFAAASNHAPDFNQRYSFSPGSPDATVLSDSFELKGRTSAAEVEIKTDLSQNWAFFNIALINQDTGDAFNVGREVSYYSGSDSDGPWSEGGRTESVTIPSVPPGNYRLLVEPEMDTPATTPSSIVSRTRASRGTASSIKAMNYEITLRHGVTVPGWYWVVGFLLVIPPIIYTIRARAFEVKRWADSDYPMVTSS
ncbi:MAG TPA: DUF4178 domain-containing protein [Bryobacteraceae bacterium]|jgi:hypothetical protein|nr:DUF4178 domain-containing protein [Bryobacteraceae bacterium]